VDEPVVLPDLKPAADAWHVYAMRLFNGRFIVVILDVYNVVKVVAVIDKLDPVSRHRRGLSAQGPDLLHRPWQERDDLDQTAGAV
jgi:hypothetical protein